MGPAVCFAHARSRAIRWFRLLSLSLAAACVAACASSAGRLEANRFQSALYPFSLFYTEAGSAEYPLGAHYTVENYESRDGRHRYAKLGPDFTIERAYKDETPNMVGREPFYDLLLARDAPAAKLWLRSVPLRKADAQEPLASVTQRYLDAASKAGRPAAPFGVEVAPESGGKAELRDVSWRPCELSKREAVRLEFSVKNPAAAHTLSEPEWLHASVVLVRSGYMARDRYPVLVLAGKSSATDNDETLEQDFDRMLDRLVLGDKFQGLSMKGDHTCGKHPPAVAAPGAETSGDLRAPTLEVPIIEEDPAQPAP